jgi:ADP-heptose:LPS heptosyltransferase
MPQKRWPTDRFADLADAARERWGLGAVIVGGSGDRERAREIRSRASAPVLDATAEPLGVSAGIIARARLLVTNDSVAMHLGLIATTPTVALFGPTNPRAVLPPAGRFRVVRPDLPCGPCFWQAKPRIKASAGRGAHLPCSRYPVSCLEEVTLAPVVAAAEDLLAKGLPR